MKKILSLLLCFALITTCMSFGVGAKSSPCIEYFEDGSYAVTEITETNSLARATKSGVASKTYFSSSGKKIVTLELTGSFNYTSGVSATATSATVAVILHTSDAKYVSRNSYCSGATAHGSVTFTYNGTNRTLTAKLTCDKYGNLS